MKPAEVEIVEVSPRDGLQNERRIVATADKIALIRKAVTAGARRIEVASFVHPARVPQMADAERVCAELGHLAGVTTIGLALNRRGAERAFATSIDQIGAVACATDGFGLANQGRTADQTVDDAVEIITLARARGRSAQATISVAFGCPFDGEVEPRRVAEIARRIAAADPLEIALGDTIGVATPERVVRVMREVASAVPGMPLRLHFHDTRNTAIANAWAALEQGATTLDSSIGGCGGCPFAPGASGNLATEDLLYLLDRSGIQSGLNSVAISKMVPWLSEIIARELPGRLSKLAPFPTLEGKRS